MDIIVKILLIFAVLFDLLVAVSMPLTQSLNLFIVGLSFANATSETSILNVPVTAFNGEVNSVPVQNVTELTVSPRLGFI